MNKRVLSLLLLFSSLCVPLCLNAEPRKISIDEAISTAISQNRDIELAKQRLAELKGLELEALSTGLPQITGDTKYQKTWKIPNVTINGAEFKMGADNTYMAGAYLNQLIWNGGKVFKAVRAARNEEARGIENIKATELQVIFKVKQTFYEILYADKVIDVLKKQIRQLRSHLNSIQTRYSKGLDSDYALMRQSVEVTNVEPDLIEAERGREILINGLKILLAIPMTEDIRPEGKIDHHTKMVYDQEALIQKAIMNRPDLAAERKHEDALREMIGVEKAAYYPTLNFNTTYYWQGQSMGWDFGPDQKSDNLSSTIDLSWPLFDGLKTHSRIKQARSRFIQQHVSNSKLADEVTKDVQDAYISLEKARKALSSQQRALSLANKATGIASERFEAGLMSQLELIDTINSQARAEQQYLRAAYSCIESEAALELAVGGNL